MLMRFSFSLFRSPFFHFPILFYISHVIAALNRFDSIRFDFYCREEDEGCGGRSRNQRPGFGLRSGQSRSPGCALREGRLPWRPLQNGALRWRRFGPRIYGLQSSTISLSLSLSLLVLVSLSTLKYGILNRLRLNG